MAKTPVGRNATYLASLMGNIKTGSPINSPAAAFIVLFGLRFRSGNSGFEIPGLYVFAGALPGLVFFFRRSDSRHGLRAQGRDGLKNGRRAARQAQSSSIPGRASRLSRPKPDRGRRRLLTQVTGRPGVWRRPLRA